MVELPLHGGVPGGGAGAPGAGLVGAGLQGECWGEEQEEEGECTRERWDEVHGWVQEEQCTGGWVGVCWWLRLGLQPGDFRPTLCQPLFKVAFRLKGLAHPNRLWFPRNAAPLKRSSTLHRWFHQETLSVTLLLTTEYKNSS